MTQTNSKAALGPGRMLVVLPNWLGDTVMASPTLRTLRETFPQSYIAYLGCSGPLAVLADAPWADATIESSRPGGAEYRQKFFTLVKKISREHFDWAVLLPNSFSSALMVCLAKIMRRIGYERDGRGLLLTDRQLPAKENGKFVAGPMIRYYLALASYLGAQELNTNMELFTNRSDEKTIDRRLSEWDIDPDCGLLLVHPGGGFGPSKRWPAERFAQVADTLSERFNLAVAISAGPSERDVAESVRKTMNHRAVNLAEYNISIGELKALVRRSRLLISNDTGPRHLAAAFGVPVITIFGSTDPAWTDTFFNGERIVQVKVSCGPCQKKTCKEDHRCMELITPQMVLKAAEELLKISKIKVQK